MTNDSAEGARPHVRFKRDGILARFLFALPEMVPLTRGSVGAMYPSVGSDVGPYDPGVVLRAHQIFGEGLSPRDRALQEFMHRTGSRWEPTTPDRADARTSWVTVIEAVTEQRSPDSIGVDEMDHPEDWSPRADAFTRCLALAQRLVIGHRQASESPYLVPTFTNLPGPVVVTQAPGQFWVRRGAGGWEPRVRVVGEWGEAQEILLADLRRDGPFRGERALNEPGVRSRYWRAHAAAANPMLLFRERWLDARHALERGGDPASAVVLSNTASEVFLDLVFTTFLWHEGSSVEDAAGAWRSLRNAPLAIVKRELPRRLGGNWSLDDPGPINDWFEHAYKLRHRVVHGGYEPRFAEAREALAAVSGLQRQFFDLLIEQRETYPRLTLLMAGLRGLERRGVNVAGAVASLIQREPNALDEWWADFAAFRAALVEARLTGLS